LPVAPKVQNWKADKEKKSKDENSVRVGRGVHECEKNLGVGVKPWFEGGPGEGGEGR